MVATRRRSAPPPHRAFDDLVQVEDDLAARAGRAPRRSSTRAGSGRWSRRTPRAVDLASWWTSPAGDAGDSVGGAGRLHLGAAVLAVVRAAAAPTAGAARPAAGPGAAAVRAATGRSWPGWAGLLGRRAGPTAAARRLLRLAPLPGRGPGCHCLAGLALVPLLLVAASGAPYPGTAPGGAPREAQAGAGDRLGAVAEEQRVGEAGDAPPTSGARMNSHSWTMASMPAKTPTPIERAGLTEVPVSAIEAKWIIASVRPMASGRQGRVLVAGVGDGEDHLAGRRGHHALDQECRPPGLAAADWSPKEFCAEAALGA